MLGDVTTAKVEEIGTMIYFNLEDYNEAKKHAKKYFSLTDNKGSERYNEILFLYVDIEEKIDAENILKAELLDAELLRKRQQNRIDSLTEIWSVKAMLLSVSADTIYKFDKNGLAVFKNELGFYGVIDDKANELISPGSYSGFDHYDNKILLFEGGQDMATKIMIFHTYSKKKIVLPPVSDFNPLSTNYGKVMLPRDNDIIVTYPNNSKKVLVYDLNSMSLKNL